MRRFSVHNLLIMLVKEFRQIRRDRRTMGIIVGMPIMMLVLFGYAVSREIRHLPMAVADYDSTSVSRNFVKSFTAPGSFDKVAESTRPKDLLDMLDKGRVYAALFIEDGFGEKMISGGRGKALMLIDGVDSQVAMTAMTYSKRISFAYAESMLKERLMRNPPDERPSEPGEAAPRYWYNPSRAKVRFYVPNLIGVIVTQVTLILTALAIVREKELGNMELLLSSPLRPSEMFVGKLFPYMLLAFVDVVIILVAATTVFGVPIHGSLALFFLLSVFYIIVSLAIGLMFSSFSANQQQALYMIMFYMIITFLLSGFIFPIITMPEPLQYVTYLVPLRYYLGILRGVLTKGVGMAALWPDVAGLCILGAAAIFAGLKSFKTTLE